MAIDPAVCLSGWRMRIDNSQEAADTGRLHVDYAQVCYPTISRHWHSQKFFKGESNIRRNCSLLYCFAFVHLFLLVALWLRQCLSPWFSPEICHAFLK